MNEKCPKCGSRLIKHTERKEMKYKGKDIFLDTISLQCEKCKTKIGPDEEDILKEKKRLKLVMDSFLTDEDIKRIRKKLGLNQKEMSETLGVGPKTFTRYETLRVRQSKAMDNLLRILDEYPEVIKVLKGKEAGDNR